MRLDFLHRERPGFADFHAGFTTKALFFIHGNGFAVLELEDLNGTDIHAFAITSALVDINSNFPAHCKPPF